MTVSKTIKNLLFILGISGIFAALIRFYIVQKNLLINNTDYRVVGVHPSLITEENITLSIDVEITNNSDVSVHLTSVVLAASASFDAGISRKNVANINTVQDQILPARGSFVLTGLIVNINPQDLVQNATSFINNFLTKQENIILYLSGNIYFNTGFLNIKASVPVDTKYEFNV